jgi:hypothetical protein
VNCAKERVEEFHLDLMSEEAAVDFCRHLESCADCRRESLRLAALERTLRRIGSAMEYEPVPMGRQTRISARRPPVPWFRLAMAAALIAALPAVSWIAQSPPRPEPRIGRIAAGPAPLDVRVGASARLNLSPGAECVVDETAAALVSGSIECSTGAETFTLSLPYGRLLCKGGVARISTRRAKDAQGIEREVTTITLVSGSALFVGTAGGRHFFSGRNAQLIVVDGVPRGTRVSGASRSNTLPK